MLMKKWYVWLALIFLPLLAGLWLTKGQQPPHIHAIASYQLTLIMILRRFYSLAVDIKQRVGPGQYRQRW